MIALIFPVLVFLLAAAPAAQAQTNDVQFTVTRQKLDETKDRSGGPVTVTTKEVQYKVEVQNRTFKDMQDLTVKYMIFYEAPQHGTKEVVESFHKGSKKIAFIESNRSTTFDTEPFKLTTGQLDGGWVYTSGAKSKSKDRVAGVWLRAFNTEGKIVGEYVNPSTLSKKNDWKE